MRILVSAALLVTLTPSILAAQSRPDYSGTWTFVPDASPGAGRNGPPTDRLQMTKIEETSVSFDNPAHDFPKMIRYTLGANGTLEAIVGGDAAQKPEVFRFEKQ